MSRNINYYLYLKVIFIICIITGGALTVNLWLYYQPSSVELEFSRWLQLGRPGWLTTLMKLISDSYVAISPFWWAWGSAHYCSLQPVVSLY